MKKIKLEWESFNDGKAWSADHGYDEYVIQCKGLRPYPETHPWYWCAGHGNDLDDNVCGWVPTLEEAKRYCELVANWRAGNVQPGIEGARKACAPLEAAFAEAGVEVVDVQ